MADENVDKGDTDGTLLGGEVKPEDVKPEDVKPEDVKPEDVKPEDVKPEDEKKEDVKPEDEKNVAPEKYEDFVFPEGSKIDDTLMGEFSTLAKDANLPQDVAQKFIDLVPKYAEVAVAAQAEQWASERVKWVAAIKADAEFGGAKFSATIEGAKRVLETFGSPEIRSFLAETGYGDNADLIRMLAKIDAVTKEDKLVDGGVSGDKGKKSAAEVLYG